MASTNSDGKRSSVKECFKRCWCFAPSSAQQPAPTDVSPPHHTQPAHHEKLAANLAAPQPTTTSPCVSAEQPAANLVPIKSPAAPSDLQPDEQAAVKSELLAPIKRPAPSDPQLHENPAAKLDPSRLLELEQDLKDKVKKLRVQDLDTLLLYIEAELNRLDPSLPGKSSSNLATRVLLECQNQKDAASCFVKTLPESLTKEVIGASESIFLPLLKQTLGGMGGVHWAGLGLSFIAWSLDNMDRTSQNHENCLKLLRKVVSLLSTVRNLIGLEDIHDDHHCMQDLQDSTEIALRCAIICSSSLNQAYLSRFFKAAKAEEVISAVEKELDGAKVTNIAIGLKAILEKMPKAYGPIKFTSDDKGIVGGAEEMQAVFEYLNKDCDVVAVCLHGMGGIGKSFRAHNIYKKFQALELYRRGRVVLNWGTESTELHQFQWKILQQVCKGEIPKFSDVEEGKQMMQTQLPKGGAIVLYLDNVMQPGHLLELLPDSTCFPPGSKILITTRNKNVFDDFKDLNIEHRECIEVKKLGKELAQELFLKKIGRDCVGTPEENLALEKVKDEVIELCDGLPLALTVISGYISKRTMDLDLWREVAEKMREAIPLQGEANGGPIYSRLRFSIDELHEKYKGAFLDIVVFAVGKSWEYAQRLVGRMCMEELLGRSLIQKTTLEEYYYSEVAVHDVLLTMGKQMANHDQAEIRITNEAEFLKNKGSLERIVGLRNIQINDANLLQQMSSLRVLDHVDIDVECPTTQLQHLKAIKIYSKVHRPIDISTCTGLKELDILWFHGTPHLEVFKGLKELEALRLHASGQLDNVQVIGSLTRLKELHLVSFANIQLLPEGINYLTGLKVLRLSLCQSMVALPEGIANLKGLEKLTLMECTSLESLPTGIANLTGLKMLDLDRCESLRLLPEGMTNMKSLRLLDLQWCTSLVSLPLEIANCTGLKELNLSWCQSLASVPEGIASMEGLKDLSLIGCESLTVLPERIANFTGLKELDLSWCKSLTSLPPVIANSTGLTKLLLIGCKSLTSLPEGIKNLRGLKEFNLSGCEGLSLLPQGIGRFTRLKELDLSRCQNLASLPDGITDLTGLQVLDLSGCGSLTSLPHGIANLTALKELDLNRCVRLTSLPEGLTQLTGLEELDVGGGCVSLTSLPEELSNSTGLRVWRGIGPQEVVDTSPLY